MSEPKILELEEVIDEFYNLVKELEQIPNLTGEMVLARVLKLYREVRIADTVLEDWDDMLLLEWGITNPFSANMPVDMRNLQDVAVEFDETVQKYLGFSRQIHQSSSEQVKDFDNDAIQMRLYLLYGEAIGDERSSDLWIAIPDHIEIELERNYENDFVKQHLKTPAIRLRATVDYCG